MEPSPSTRRASSGKQRLSEPMQLRSASKRKKIVEEAMGITEDLTINTYRSSSRKQQLPKPMQQRSASKRMKIVEETMGITEDLTINTKRSSSRKQQLSKPSQQRSASKRMRRVEEATTGITEDLTINTQRASSNKQQHSEPTQLKSSLLMTLVGKVCQSRSHVDENDRISNLQAVVGQSSTSRPRLRVLSLFDGIGTGYFVLDKMGFDIEAYYASEICPHALLLTKSHFGHFVQHLGSVENIDEKVLNEIGPINFLIGGSPCSELSCVNPNKKGLFDAEGSGILFFEYYRIFDSLKKRSVVGKYEFFWLFENVKNMENINKNIISYYLDREPCTVNSLCVSPQRRERYFWSNLPNISKRKVFDVIKTIGPILDDFLDKNLGRKATVEKICTITTKKRCLQDGNSKNPVLHDGEFSDLYITEIETIFGFPLHFTDVGNMNNKQRHILLGKSWCALTITLIFQCLFNYFNWK